MIWFIVAIAVAYAFWLFSKTKKNPSVPTFKKATESMGIDISPELNDPKIKPILVAHAKKTCNAIENIPQQYRDKVAKAVLDNFYGTLPDGRSLLEQLQSICQMSKQEARLIATDQTSKLTGRLNQARQEDIGVEEYIWRTVGGQRVRPSTPSMANSNTYCDHYERDGKKFRWDRPPHGGHPGQSRLCRCRAEAVIDPEKIVSKATRT
jgi:SPP1 gp7 family putative phage head morphogenesis protein